MGSLVAHPADLSVPCPPAPSALHWTVSDQVGEEGAIVENVTELAKRQTRRHKLCLRSREEGSGPWAQKSACLGKSWFCDLEHLGLSSCLRFLQYKRELIVVPH